VNGLFFFAKERCRVTYRSRRWGVEFSEFKLYVDNLSLVYQQHPQALSAQQQRGKQMPNPPPTLPNNPPPSAQGVIRNDGGASGNAGYCIVALTPSL
jgi:hypothetical protein